MVEKKGSGTNAEQTGDLNVHTLHLYTDPKYQPPTPADVRAVIRQLGLKGSEVAKVVRVSSETVRRWQTSTESSGHKPMPYGAWRLLLNEAGLVEPCALRKKLS